MDPETLMQENEELTSEADKAIKENDLSKKKELVPKVDELINKWKVLSSYPMDQKGTFWVDTIILVLEDLKRELLDYRDL